MPKQTACSWLQRKGLTVVGAFMCYFLAIASLQVIGIYMTALLEEFNIGSAMLGWICSLAYAVQCVVGPFTSVIINKFGHRWAVMAGGAVEALGIISSHFVQSTTGLLICLGVVPGLGASLIYVSGPVIIASYFPKRYSTVTGVVFAGVGAGLFIFPPLIEELISIYGWRNAVLIHGAIIFNTSAMGALFRPVPSRNDTHYKKQTSKVDISQSDNKKETILEYRYCQINDHVSGNFEESENIRMANTVKCTEKSTTCVKWYPRHLLLFVNKPTIVLVFLTSFFTNGAYSAAIVHTSNQIVGSGYSEREGALAVSFLGIGSLISRLLHGAPVDSKIIAPSTLYELALFLAAAATFLNPIVNTYSGWIVSATCIGFASGILFPILYTIMRQMIGTSLLTTATGLELFVDFWAIMAGGYFGGAVRDMTGNYYTGLYIFGAVYLLGACSLLPVIILEKRKKTCVEVTNRTRV